MRLAVQLHCTLEELGGRMSSEEFGLWLTFQEEEPIGPAAMLPALCELLAALANGPLQPPKNRKVWNSADFMGARWQSRAPVAPPQPTLQDVVNLFTPPG